MERRLAAILAADVVEYSRLMGDDEEGTLSLLKTYREEIFDPAVSSHSGRIVKLMGDGALVEFASVVDAVQCAVEIQKATARRIADQPETERLALRIGINLGDVIVDGDDIYGDGVNVAARLESLAEPGGICLSDSVVAQISHRVDLEVEPLGPQRLKNIAEPVMAYRAVWPGLPTPQRQRKPSAVRRRVFAAAIPFLAAVLAAAGWLLWPEAGPPPVESARERPSIVILPFDNLSGDPEEDHISDGISEDLTTDLSRVNSLFVFSRNVAGDLKPRIAPGQRESVDPMEVARTLSVDYIVEGSVRRYGGQLRINAQLIDGATGGHLWADRFDRDVKDVFVVLDEVILEIVSALKIELTPSEREELADARVVNPDAWDRVLRGIVELRRFTRESNREARRYFLEAIKLDPEYARAYANVAFTYSIETPFGWTSEPEKSVELAIQYAEKAKSLNDEIVQIHLVLSNIYVRQKRFEEAVSAAKRSLEIDPNYADGYAALTLALLNAGRYEEALPPIRKALQLDPRGPFFFFWLEGRCLFMLERYEEALEKFELVVERNPQFIGGLKYLAATQAMLGKVDDAEWTVEEIAVLQPGITLSQERVSGFGSEGVDPESYLEGLRRAGVPE